jgi:predicted dehydrogenase
MCHVLIYGGEVKIERTRDMGASLSMAIIGCGGIARSHAEAIQQVDGARLVATADIDAQRAEALASEFGAPQAYSTYEDALSDPSVDAVIVCLPHHLHAEAVIAAAGAGKHILCEKPMTTTLTDVDGMITAADMAGVVLMVGQVLRFREANILARKLLEEGRIGQSRHLIRRRYHHMRTYPSAPWATDPEKAGGWVLYGFGSHEVDMLLWLLDAHIREVYARGARVNPQWRDYDDIAIQMWLAKDIVATLTLSLNCHTDVWDTVIIGDEGSMLVTGQEVVVNGEPRPAPMHPSGGFVPQLAEFVSAVREGREPQASGADVRRTMVALEAVKVSLGTQRPVRSEDLLPSNRRP